MRRLTACLCSAALLSLLVYVDPIGAEQKITLTEAIRTALEESYEIRAFRSSVSARREAIGVARSQLLPKLAFEERAARTNNPPSAFMMKLNQQRFSQNDFAIGSLNNPDPITDYQSMFSFEQPLFVMKSYLDLNMAKLQHSAGNEELRRKMEEIAFKVSQAYLRVHTAKAYEDVASRAIRDATEHVRIAESMYRNGLGLYSDVLRARTSLTESEQKQVTFKKDLAVSKRWFAYVLGRHDPVSPADERLEFILKDVAYYTDASLSRKDAAAMKIRHESAMANVKRAESLYLPSIGVGASYQFNDHMRIFGSEGESWLLMASLRWNLFDGLLRDSERKKAQHEAAEMKEHLRNLTHLISFKVEEAYLGVDEARKNEELARSALLSAEESKRLVKERYGNSLSPIVDLLDVQLHVNRARADTVARENEYRLAIIGLGYESGTILKDLGIE
ncbi:MAG TPA: TolC family protein [Syntrophorhabdaceae bacterium]|jgi:outer membrane protein TolC